MEVPTTMTMLRQRITLSDQLSNNLRRPHKTLASILEADKILEAAEEQSRQRPAWTVGSASTSSSEVVGGTVRVSLMRLMGMGVDDEDADVTRDDGDRCCCVCMARMKGAAFIPCGHTFCRVCSKQMMASRGNCPLCNALIAGVLDLF